MKTIIMICALAFSFMPGSRNTKSNPGLTMRAPLYNWFDTSGNYLRQNTALDEAAVSGWSGSANNPKTIQEKGFDPADCTGNPPVPNNPSSPDELLYSHP